MRRIVRIDDSKCNGCGLCVPTCAEGAIQVIDGKARLVAENLCDALGNCLGACPRGAITIEERAADGFDEAAVEARHRQGREGTPRAAANGQTPQAERLPCGCPGTMMRKLKPSVAEAASTPRGAERRSRLSHWPVQLSLLPTRGQMWQNADVLIAADCVGFAAADFHEQMLAGGEKTLAIACPKLDDVGRHVEKLAAIFADSSIRSLTVAHMEVPCCGGIVAAVNKALAMSGRTDIPMREITVAVDGSIVNERQPA